MLRQHDGIAKVGQFDFASLLDEDIVRLDVTMNNILLVQVHQASQRLVETVLAESLRVFTLQVFEHGCEGAAVHQLHEDPQAVLVVKRLEALHNRFVLRHLHDADLILNSLSLGLALRLCELESEQLTVSNAFASEDAGETTDAFLAYDLVILRRVLLLDVGSVLDPSRDLTRVLQRLLWLIELTKDDLEERARVLADLVLAEDAHL